MKDTVLLVK